MLCSPEYKESISVVHNVSSRVIMAYRGPCTCKLTLGPGAMAVDADVGPEALDDDADVGPEALDDDADIFPGSPG